MFQLILLFLTRCYCYKRLLVAINITIISLLLPCRTISQGAIGSCSSPKDDREGGCGPSSYAGTNKAYPFWGNQVYEELIHCGYPGFSFKCNNSTRSPRPVLNISNDLYYVQSFQRRSLLVLNLDFYQNNCPRPRRNFTVDPSIPLFVDKRSTNFTYFFNCTSQPPPPSHLPPEVSVSDINNETFHLACLDYNDTSSTYVFRNDLINPKILEWSWKDCEENIIVPLMLGADDQYERIVTWKDIVHQLSINSYNSQNGFLVTWNIPVRCESCESSGGLCIYDEMKRSFDCTYCSTDYKGQTTNLVYTESDGYYCNSSDSSNNYQHDPSFGEKKMDPKTITMIGVFTGVGGLTVPAIILLFVYLRYEKKRRGATAPNVDLFLENYGCLSLQRYMYKDIKKMTKSFKDKLGQGGYGSVFKGKLVDGRLVAVKVLADDPEKSTNGEEFINEVATIGRTNHVNIVALLGFCSSGSKRALVYEFMPNGSLEKFIYAKKENTTIIKTETTSVGTTTVVSTTTITTATHQLGWEKLYQIALGIARGLEYLHRGCDTGRILHFDIKPHNILLDENFCPKISDFGLAKLCPTRESTVSMLGGRGTVGYIAPEVYCRNFGGVSYKSDVYSYGMMVLEMVGGRKNIDPFVDNTSEIYFPHWIYDHLEDQKDKIENLLKFEEVIEEEMAKKMILVGLWCIQTNPSHRPSMGRVAEMLDGRIEDLQMPPKPIVDLSSPPPPPPLLPPPPPPSPLPPPPPSTFSSSSSTSSSSSPVS